MLRSLLLTFVLCAPVWTAGIDKDPPLRWWKGNLHTHSMWVEGDDFPEMIAEWYRERGYHFVSLTEHNLHAQGELWLPSRLINERAGVDAVARYRARFGDSWVETRERGGLEVRVKSVDETRALVEERDRFLLLPGEEITGAAADGRALHMNAVNIAEELPVEMGATVRETLVRNMRRVEESARRFGRTLHFHVNHPNYKWGVTAEDLAAVAGLRFFEVWNGVETDNDPGDDIRPSTDAIWDIANTLRIVRYGGRPLFGLGTDDAHDYQGNKRRALAGRAWIMVRARHLTPESLFAAMRQGDFYASSGVTLSEVSYSPEPKTLTLRIDARPGETFTTRFIGTRRGANTQGRPRTGKDGQPLDVTLDYGPRIGEVLAEVSGPTPTYRFRGDELYVRAVVTSSLGTEVPSSEHPHRRAWTQPVGW